MSYSDATVTAVNLKFDTAAVGTYFPLLTCKRRATPLDGRMSGRERYALRKHGGSSNVILVK